MMLERATVLIADDNAADRFLLAAILEAEGYHVISAANGREDVQKYRDLKPKIVLLEVLMPKIDGWEVARQIKAMAGETFVPIIFLTSLTHADDLTRCVDSGGDDFLSKPYHSMVLRAKLSALERQQHTHDTMLAQRDQISRLNAYLMHEQAAAKAVMDRVVHTGSLDSDNIKYLVSPLAVFNGDVLLAGFNPGGDLFVFVGDFTGHGLTAGIGAMPLADVFYTMTQKGFSVADLVREANRKLAQILPAGYFCCATVVRISYTKGTLEFWNGGLPAGYLVRSEPGGLEKLESMHLPLGILGPERFSSKTQMLNFEPGDQLLLFTDGLLEGRDAQGNMFGERRLENLVTKSGPVDSLFDDVRDAAREQRGSAARDDDVTLLAVEMLQPIENSLEPLETTFTVECVPQDWRFRYELGPDSLRGFNPLPLMHQIIMEVPEMREAAGQISAVLAEAYSNALEHGVLGLKSLEKHDAQGFAEYYSQRESALQSLSAGFVRFEIDCNGSYSNGELRIRVVDSGSGFDHDSRTAAVADGSYAANYHGRGLPLLKRMCDTVSYVGDGSTLELVLCWESPLQQVA